MYSQITRVWNDWLKNRTPYHDSDTFVEPQNFQDAVQFRTVVLAVEIDEPTTKKFRECGAKETQLSLILLIIVSCLIFPINFLIFNFYFYGKLIKMQGDYVLICKGISHLSPSHFNQLSISPAFPLNNQSRTQLFRQLIRGLSNIFPPKRTKQSELM